MTFLNYLSGNINKDYDKEKSRKTIMINIFSLLGLIALLIFGTKRLLNGEMQAAIVDYSISGITFFILVFLKVTKRVNIAAHATVILYDDEATWLSGVYSLEVFDTTRANVSLANEVSGAPVDNAQL